MRFIEEAENCESIIVTIQKEVAERITADAGDSEYGAITASINAVADSVITMYIGREKFLPPPNVDSAVVKITLNKNKYDIKDEPENVKGLESLKEQIQVGASPRATLALNKAARANALVNGRAYATPQDVKSVVYDVLRHRILLTYEAEAENITSDKIIDRILSVIPVP